MADKSASLGAWLRDEGPNPLTCELKFTYQGESQANSEHTTINAGDMVSLAMLFAAQNVQAFRLFCVHLAMSDPPEPELAEQYKKTDPALLYLIAEAVLDAAQKAEQAHDPSNCGSDGPCGSEARHEH
jgi:hypothetical protein